MAHSAKFSPAAAAAAADSAAKSCARTAATSKLASCAEVEAVAAARLEMIGMIV